MKQRFWAMAIFISSLVLVHSASAAAYAQADGLMRRSDAEQVERNVVANRTAIPMHTFAAAPAQVHRPALSASAAYTVFVPVAIKTSFILGRVTLRGTPSGGEPIELRTLNGTVLTTTTDANGTFAFANPPLVTRSPSTSYYVRYYNISPTYNGRLAAYLTRNFLFAGGESVDLGSFDIADIALVAPFEGATATLPRTFQWSKRAAALASVDSYVLEIRPSNTTTQMFKSDELGYVESYALITRPFDDGAATQSYRWGVEVVNPGPAGNQPLGLSYYVRKITLAD
jgi:hypothetical protein